MTGKFSSAGYTADRTPTVTFEIPGFDLQACDEWQGKDLDVEVKEHKNHRSKDANAYLWVLCDEIAKEMSKEGKEFTKETVYRMAVREVGVFTALKIWKKQYEAFCRAWQANGIAWFVEEVSEADGFVNIHAYYGSSVYDTSEMSRLIDWIVEQAESIGIHTMTEQELKKIGEGYRTCGKSG